MTKTAERYDLVTGDIPMDAAQMKPSGFGEWVRFDDHKMVIDTERRKTSFLEDAIKNKRLKATKKSYEEFMRSLEDMAENTRLRLRHLHEQASAALSKDEFPGLDTYADMAELRAKLEAFVNALEYQEIVEREFKEVEDQLQEWRRRMTREIVAFTPASASRNDHYLSWLGDIMRRAHGHFPDL